MDFKVLLKEDLFATAFPIIAKNFKNRVSNLECELVCDVPEDYDTDTFEFTVDASNSCKVEGSDGALYLDFNKDAYNKMIESVKKSKEFKKFAKYTTDEKLEKCIRTAIVDAYDDLTEDLSDICSGELFDYVSQVRDDLYNDLRV